MTEMPEDIENIIDRKVEKRVEKERKKLEKEFQRTEISKNSRDQGISRRGFLKKIGAGTLSLGALGRANASGIKLSNQNIELGSNGALSGESATVKILNNVVYAGHPDFSTLQEALDFANSNNYREIRVPQSGAPYGSIDPYSDQLIKGDSTMWDAPLIDGGTSDHAVDMTVNGAGRVCLKNLRLQTDNGGGTSFNCVNIDGADCGDSHTIKDCFFRSSDNHGVRIVDTSGDPMRYNTITNCYFANDIENDSVYLGSNSDRNVVTANTSGAGWSVTDNGSRNSVNTNP